MDLDLHPQAMTEARQARLWYLERSQDAATEFVAELDRAFERILDAPFRWPLRDGVRKLVLRRFPYVIVYRASESVVEIVAVAHARRRPDYWASRT